ncbi:MAG: hypothetical protein J7K87_04265 [Candidatus Aenigmarchaeota archaeon]|nr:hypothetical protein [Candidatus Aenigmarchaeota archaeon]
MSPVELNEIFDEKKTISSISELLYLQEKTLKAPEKYKNPFYDYIKRYGILENYEERYVGTPDKLTDYFTEKVIGEKLEEYDKRLLQFFMIPCTPANESGLLYVNGLKLFEEDKDFFDPRRILKKEENELSKVINHSLGSRGPESVARAWIENSKKLVEEYDGDPKNIFHYGMHPREAFRRVKNFREFGNKNAALFLKEMIESGAYDPGESRRYTPIPADIHVMRFTIRTSSRDRKKTIETLNGMTHQKLAREIQTYLMNITSEAPIIDPIKADDAIWIWEKEKCSRKKCNRCPVKECSNEIIVTHQHHESGDRIGKRNGKIIVTHDKNMKLDYFGD